MPNTTPAGDSVAWIREQIEDSALPVRIAPSACISKGRLGKEIADLERLAEAGAVAFTDDGSFVNDEDLMREAMRRAAILGKPVMQHAVVPSILGSGVIRDCAVAKRFALPVMSPEAETEAVRRDIRLCRDTGCALHIQHISCAGTVDQIRAAQKEGLPVTGEATPHHILFSCEDIPDNDANWKMAPPLGSSDDRAAIRAAVKDGTLGIFATDHAPHPFASKQGGFIGTANGIIGLEVAVAITYNVMVEQEGMDVNEWAKRWTEGPARLIGEEPDGETVIDLQANKTVDNETFKSLSRNMPYMGLKFSAWPISSLRA
jgi:dihydroorotase